MDIRTQLEKILNNPLHTDKDINASLLHVVYEQNKGNTLELFLNIQELDKKRIRAENQLLYRGVESGMHSFSSLARTFLDNKTSHKAKSLLKFMLEENNAPYLIDVCKAYFPSGESKGASNNGVWFFDKFKDMLLVNKDNYDKDGKDYKWAKMFNHLEYIELVLLKNKEDEK